MRLEHLLSEETAGRGFKVYQEHLLSEEIGKGDRKEAEYWRFNTMQVSGTARFAKKCLRRCCNSLVSVNNIYNRKDGNRPGTEVQALGFPLPDSGPKRSLTYWKRKQNVKRISTLLCSWQLTIDSWQLHGRCGIKEKAESIINRDNDVLRFVIMNYELWIMHCFSASESSKGRMADA